MLQEISFEERRIHIWDEPSALPLSLPFLQENAPYLPKAERPSAGYKELVLKNVLLQHEIAHLYFYQKQYGLSMTSVFLWRKRFHSWRTWRTALRCSRSAFLSPEHPMENTRYRYKGFP